MRAPKSLLVLGMTVLLAKSGQPMAGIPYPYASEFTQLLVLARQAMQVIQEAQMIETQLKMFKQQGIEGRLFTALEWGQIAHNMVALANNVRQGQGLAYTMSHLDVAFRAAYPGYMTSGIAFNKQYAGWNRTSLDTLAGILASVGAHSDQLGSDVAILNFMQDHAQSAIGQDQILQAGNEIAAFNDQQLLKLRQLMMLQTTAMVNAEGRQVNDEQVKQQILGSAIGPGKFRATN